MQAHGNFNWSKWLRFIAERELAVQALPARLHAVQSKHKTGYNASWKTDFPCHIPVFDDTETNIIGLLYMVCANEEYLLDVQAVARRLVRLSLTTCSEQPEQVFILNCLDSSIMLCKSVSAHAVNNLNKCFYYLDSSMKLMSFDCKRTIYKSP